MRNYPLVFLISMMSVGFCVFSCQPSDNKPTSNVESDFKVYFESLDTMDQMFDAETKKNIASGDYPETHIDRVFGMEIRERLGLWKKDSTVGVWFRVNHISHPDIMSSALLDGWILRLKGENVNPSKILKEFEKQQEELTKAKLNPIDDGAFD